MPKSARFGFLLALVVFLTDQLAKYVFLHTYDPFNPNGMTVLPIFRLIFVENHGVSLGLFTANSEGQRWALVAITLIISLGAGAWLARETNRFEALGLGMIVGGAVGNVLDRVRLGYVVDFLNLHFGGWSPFLVFNVADSAITVGVMVLLVHALFAGRVTELEKKNA